MALIETANRYARFRPQENHDVIYIGFLCIQDRSNLKQRLLEADQSTPLKSKHTRHFVSWNGIGVARNSVIFCWFYIEHALERYENKAFVFRFD